MKFLSFLIIVLLPHLNAQPDSTKWKQYSRIGSVSVDSTSGVFGFFRLNRKTDITYKDLRLFAYGIQNQSFVYLRYKSSNKYGVNSKFYRYTISSIRKNTRVDMDLQYHYNQGFGYFVNQYKNGLINIEVGHGFDMSDYLNATRKTSYLKGGIFWDHNTPWLSSKLEYEHFQQISEIVESNLSRNQYIFEVIFPLNKNVYINLNIEVEDFLIREQTDASSLTLAVGWEGDIRKLF
mgnify:FL=1|tara:strand:- start:210 stop:914 length:705 start_codon:yes stop_codon:yes gene_type:complete